MGLASFRFHFHFHFHPAICRQSSVYSSFRRFAMLYSQKKGAYIVGRKIASGDRTQNQEIWWGKKEFLDQNPTQKGVSKEKEQHTQVRSNDLNRNPRSNPLPSAVRLHLPPCSPVPNRSASATIFCTSSPAETWTCGSFLPVYDRARVSEGETEVQVLRAGAVRARVRRDIFDTEDLEFGTQRVFLSRVFAATSSKILWRFGTGEYAGYVTQM